MEFRLLGPVTVVDGDREVTIRQRRQRALLALLLLHLGETVAVDRIVDELWGADAPRTALASLHNAVSRLRALVGAHVLVTRAPGYALDVEPHQVDARRFEHLLAEAQAAFSVQDHATAALVLREALALWRGPALADLAYEPFAQAEIRRLEELRLRALEERLEADLARGRHEDVVAELERLVANEPLREHPRRLLMLALYRSGRQADALGVFRAARQTLVGELGIEPGPELRQLERAILRQDRSLLLPGSEPVGPTTLARSRRLATILFADAVVASAGEDYLDPERFHDLFALYRETARTVLRRHGGWVERIAGETVMAAFGAQAADERHALRAARAALDLCDAVAALAGRFAELGARIELRVGVAAGEVLVSGAHPQELYVSGEAVHVAAGLQRAAAAGKIAIGPLARRLLGPTAVVEPLGELDLRGRSRTVTAFRLVKLAAAAEPGAERLDAPLVGRDRELRALRATLREARRSGSVRALCLLGPAGIGKSRLARELARGTRGFDVLGATCPAYGEGLTYLPVRDLVGTERHTILAALQGEPDAAILADRLVTFAGPATEIARAFARWCEARARRRPLLLVVDDLHWAETTFLELLEHTATHADGPIVFLGMAREELLDEHPGLLASWEQVELGGLALADTETLVDHLLAGAPLPADSRARVFDAAEGNPLFLEQLVAFAAEGESLDHGGPLPATLQALLSARLDRLGPGERAVLERAAVIGREFREEQVAALLEPDAVPTTSRHLASLVRRGFVRAAATGELRFRHVLLQEAAYRAAPKSLRAQLHERFADALDAGGAPEALVGYHLEQAYRLRTELGPPDRAARRIAEDAGRRLGAAGIRAWKRYDTPAAVNLLERATALLPETDADRLELLCELGTVFKWRQEDVRAEAVLAEAARLSDANGHVAIRLRAELETAWPRVITGVVSADDVLALATRAIDAFAVSGDHRSLGRAWLVAASIHGPIRSRWSMCRTAASRALEHYLETGFSAAPCFAMLASAITSGPMPVAEAIDACAALSSQAMDDRVARTNVLTFASPLFAMRGDLQRARESLDDARASWDDANVPVPPDWFQAAAGVELLAGDAERAERMLRDACANLAVGSDHAWLSTLTSMLADAVYARGDFENALELGEYAERIAPPDDLVAQVSWRLVCGKAGARAGALEQAERLAREANDMLRPTDAMNEKGKAALDLTEILYVAGRDGEAEALARRAVAVLERKGNEQGVACARRRLAEFGSFSR